MNNKNITLMVGMLMIGNVGMANLYDAGVDIARKAAEDMRLRQIEWTAIKYTNLAINYGAQQAGVKSLVTDKNLNTGSVKEILSEQDPRKLLNMGASAVAGLKAAECFSYQVDKYIPVVQNREAYALIQFSAAIGGHISYKAAERAIAGQAQKAEDAINDAIDGIFWYVVYYAAHAAGYPLNGSLYETIFKK